MTKVHILTTCDHCNGQAYLPLSEVEDALGRKYMQHTLCPLCNGSGQRPKWIDLQEFAQLLGSVLCPHTRTAFQGRMHFSAGEPWDDIQEVCIDCGARPDGSIENNSIHDIA